MIDTQDFTGPLQTLTHGELVTNGQGNQVLLDGLDRASSVAVSNNDRFIYITGRDSDSISVFERDLATDTLALVDTIHNGVNGVRGLEGASAVKLTPDGNYVVVSGEESDALAVFQIADADTGRLQFAQLLRNNVGGTLGLKGPGSLAFAMSGEHLFAGGSLGLAEFDNLSAGSSLPEPSHFLTELEGIEALTVTTGAGDDNVTLIRAPGAEVVTTTINTAGGDDSVVLQDLIAAMTGDLLTPTTMVNLGVGDDRAELRADRPGTSVAIDGGEDDDSIFIQVMGEEARAVVSGGAGLDTVQVAGANLPFSSDPNAILVAHGDAPNSVPQDEGDTLRFDPQGEVTAPLVPTPNAGTLRVTTPTQRVC